MALSDAPALRGEFVPADPPEGLQVPPGMQYNEFTPSDESGGAEDSGVPELPAPLPGETPDVPVVVALLRARRDIQNIGKTQEYRQGQTRYNYRGVDQVVNAARPVLDRHGLVLIPQVSEYIPGTFDRQGGGRSHESFVRMRYWVYGPQGDKLDEPVEVVGQANDTSDKDAAKAQSVAWRVALIQLLHIATGDPDPDATRIERAAAPYNPTHYRDEALKPSTSVARINQMIHELRSMNRGTELVENEEGNDEQIGPMLVRLRKERAGG